MRSQRLKTFVVSLVSFVLLYYSAAWAVLGCFDGEDHSHHGSIVSSVGLYEDHVNTAFNGHAHDFIDCSRVDYHVETLAPPTSPTQLDRFSAESRSVSSACLCARIVADESAREHWLRTVAQKNSSLPHLSELPLYLSLSVFRI